MERHKRTHHLPIGPTEEEERTQEKQERNDHESADQNCKQKCKLCRTHVLVGASGCICHSCDSVWQYCDRCEEHSKVLYAFRGERVCGKCLGGSTSSLNESKKEKEEETYAPSRAIFNDAMVEFDIKPEKSARYDMHIFLSSEKGMIEKILRDELRKRKGIRVYFSLKINFSKHFANDDSSVQLKRL